MAIEEGYSICLNEWALDKNIKAELNLLVIISSLTASEGYCYASNQWFADLFEIDEVSVSRKLKKLEQAGYITINYKKRGFEVVNREIRLTKMLNTINKNVNRPLTKMLSDDLQKCESSINKNVNYNITNNNITNNNITSTQKGGIENKNEILEKNINNQKQSAKISPTPPPVKAPKIEAGAELPKGVMAKINEWNDYPDTRKSLIDYCLALIDSYVFKDTVLKNRIDEVCRMANKVPKGIEIICSYNINGGYKNLYKPGNYAKLLAQSTVISKGVDEGDNIDLNNLEEIW